MSLLLLTSGSEGTLADKCGQVTEFMKNISTSKDQFNVNYHSSVGGGQRCASKCLTTSSPRGKVFIYSVC